MEVFGLIVYSMLVSMPTLQYFSQNVETLLWTYEYGGWCPFEKAWFLVLLRFSATLSKSDADSAMNVQEFAQEDAGGLKEEIGCLFKTLSFTSGGFFGV